MKNILFCLFWCCMLDVLICLEIKQLKRTVDMSSNVIREKHDFIIDCNDQCKNFDFSLKSHLVDYIALINAKVKDNKGKIHIIEPKKEMKHEQDEKFVNYKIEFNGLKPTELYIRVYYLPGVAKPLPSTLKQNEKQFLLFVGDKYEYSSYKIINQTLIFKFPLATKIESYTDNKDGKVLISTSSEMIQDLKQIIKYKTLTYGPFDNIGPFSSADITIHYEHNVPIPVITELNRDIIISHWGLLFIKESINLINSGASLLPPFSRLKFQQPGGEPGIALTNFHTILPPLASSITYKDEIGNISTSNVRYHLVDSEPTGPVEIIIRPRFPLFGGWKTFFTLGYNLPTFPYLSYDSKKSLYRLKMRFIDHIYHDQIVNHAKVRVIMPEGARIFKVDTPFSLNKIVDMKKPLEKYYTYLDTVGRPVIEMIKENLIDEHIQDFILEYQFPTIYMLQEPLLLIAAYFFLFCIVIVYVRLDFSITKDEATEAKMRISGEVDKFKTLLDERVSLYDSYIECINKFKSDKDLTAFTNNKKKVEMELKKVSQKISELQAHLKADSPEMAEKLHDIQNLDKTLKDQIMAVWVSNAEKTVAGKMTRQLYMDAEKISSAKKDDILDRMSMIFN